MNSKKILLSSISPLVPIILASGSESRRIMLEDAGLDFKVSSSSVDEDILKQQMAGMPFEEQVVKLASAKACLLYTSPSPRDLSTSRMPSSA